MEFGVLWKVRCVSQPGEWWVLNRIHSTLAGTGFFCVCAIFVRRGRRLPVFSQPPSFALLYLVLDQGNRWLWRLCRDGLMGEWREGQSTLTVNLEGQWENRSILLLGVFFCYLVLGPPFYGSSLCTATSRTFCFDVDDARVSQGFTKRFGHSRCWCW